MAALPSQQVGVYQTPLSSEDLARSSLLDMKHYLSEGLEEVKHRRVRHTRSFTDAIETQTEDLNSGNATTGQYVVFAPLARDGFEKIWSYRNTHHKGLRFMYLEDEEALVVKIPPSIGYHIVSNEFINLFSDRAAGIGLRSALVNLGGGTIQGIRSLKEANGAFKPWMIRPRQAEWPTLVIECGIHISLKRLRAECRWWLENSMGEVQIVLLLSISEVERKIHLEQWEISVSSSQLSQADPHSPATPIKTHELDIIGPIYTGSPLTLDFKKIFLRPPGPGEGNIVFTAEDLTGFATFIWRACNW